jgi:glycosyltransferase involved in cell wall biosynthesis
MAHGTAVITSNAPALVEVTGDAALHVDARDARALPKRCCEWRAMRAARDARRAASSARVTSRGNAMRGDHSNRVSNARR